MGYGAQKVRFNANASGGDSINYLWSPSTNLSCSTCISPLFTPEKGGTYQYSVNATNNFGCTSTQTITFCVLDIRADYCNNKKVYICHTSAKSSKKKTYEISKTAVAKHLNKNPDDELGKCGQSCNLNKMDLTKSEDVIEPTFIVCSPNPYSNSFTLNYDRDESESTSLIIYNSFGKQIQFYDLTNSFDETEYGQGLPTGIYLAKFDNGIISKTIRLVKIK